MVPFINYKKEYRRLKKEYDSAYQRVMAGGNLILRGEVEKFEEKLAYFVRTKYAVALNSGTDAIYLALKSLGLLKYIDVAVPSHTFKSTCGAIINAGGCPK